MRECLGLLGYPSYVSFAPIAAFIHSVLISIPLSEILKSYNLNDLQEISRE